MLGGLWFGYACFGMILAVMGPLIEPMREEFGLSRTAMGSVLGAWPLIYVATAISAGVVTDRLGLRRSLAIGILLISISAALRAVAVDYFTLLGAVAVFGLGGPLVSVGAPKLARQWFAPKQRPGAIGLYTSGPMIGTIIALVTANSVVMPLTGDSWRLTLAIYSLVGFASTIAWLLVARSDESKDPPYAEHVANDQPQRGQAWALLQVTPIQVLLAVGFASQAYSLGLLNWMPDVLQENGKSAETAGYLAAVPIVVGAILALSAPRYISYGQRLVTLVILFATGTLGPLLILAGADPLTVLGLGAIGARTLVFPLSTVLLMDVAEVTSANMGVASGLYFSANQAGGVAGPLLIGVLTDSTGGFEASLVVLSVVSIVLTPLVFALRPANRAEPVAEEPLAV